VHRETSAKDDQERHPRRPPVLGSRTPPEIALATLAGLLADRNGRPGGFEFV
jgi:xanthine dehydrogenase accessory factor